MNETLTPAQIKEGLDLFCGTETYHRLVMNKNVLATDGVAWLCENASSYWLMDVIASYQSSIQRNVKFASLNDFQAWKLVVKNNSGVVTCTDGNSEKPLIKQKIPYTDFPLDEMKIWVEPGGNSTMVAMLPSER